jgi:hypothetical protein
MKHLTNKGFQDLPYAYPEVSGSRSWKATQERVGKISALHPKLYDCCVNSCVCYTGEYADLRQCPIRDCQEPRYDARNRPRRRFSYIPLKPRLRAFVANAQQAAKMLYRSEFQHAPAVVQDIFDGLLYRRLLGKFVHPVDGHPQRHRYFDAPTDVALGLSTDGYAPFRRRSKTAWPLVIFNYNLPPDVRFHQENVLCVGVIPGPNKPKDFDSYLWPLMEELLELELGVSAYDAISEQPIQLRAYLLTVFGDIPAVSMVMHMKGHNGICPCRFCNIHGVRVPGQDKSPYYVPLDRSHHPDAANGGVPAYDARNLPRRTHAEFLAQARAVEFATTVGERDRLAKEYGIKGVPVLSYLSTISFPHSFPYDFMHLIWENIIKNMFLFWFGDFKGLDTGSGSYHLDPKIIEVIGKESAASGASIPYAFGPKPPDIAEKVSWTADTRSFWTCHLGPPLLRDRLPAPYYNHFIDLVKLLMMCMEFEMAADKIEELRSGFAQWVEDYERYAHSPIFFLPLLIDSKDVLSVQSLTAIDLHRHRPRAAPYRRHDPSSWPCVDDMGVPHGTLLRSRPAGCQRATVRVCCH